MKIRGSTIFIVILLAITIILSGCGSSNSKTANTTIQRDNIKEGVVAFVRDILSKEVNLPAYIENYIRNAKHYNLTVNASAGSIFFTLTASISGDIPPTSTGDMHVRINIGDGKLDIEGFILSSSFKKTASVVFSGQMAWVKTLIYDKVVIFSVGTDLPYNAKEFILYTMEDNPWNTYISLKYMGITEGEPQKDKNGEVYTIKLKDGHIVYLRKTNEGIAIYR